MAADNEKTNFVEGSQGEPDDYSIMSGSVDMDSKENHGPEEQSPGAAAPVSGNIATRTAELRETVDDAVRLSDIANITGTHKTVRALRRQYGQGNPNLSEACQAVEVGLTGIAHALGASENQHDPEGGAASGAACKVSTPLPKKPDSDDGDGDTPSKKARGADGFAIKAAAAFKGKGSPGNKGNKHKSPGGHKSHGNGKNGNGKPQSGGDEGAGPSQPPVGPQRVAFLIRNARARGEDMTEQMRAFNCNRRTYYERKGSGQCLNCGASDHRVAECPSKPDN